MSNLPNLPLFENSIKTHKDNHEKSPTNLNLPDLENESFSNQLHGDFESDLMLTGELAKEYKKIKDSYRKLIYTYIPLPILQSTLDHFQNLHVIDY